MTQPLPWIFEECSPEDARDDAGHPWQHAVRGRKPAGRVVTGYGHSVSDADHDARTKATQYDAREVLGQRGEAIIKTAFGEFGVTPVTLESVQHGIVGFFGQYGVSETMLLDAGWRIEDGAWIAPPNLIDWTTLDMMPIGT